MPCKKCGADNWYYVPSGPQAGYRRCRPCQARRTAAREPIYRALKRLDPERRRRELEFGRKNGRKRRLKPEYLARVRAYRSRPEIKAHINNRERQRRRNYSPEIKEKWRAWYRARYLREREGRSVSYRMRRYGLTLDQFHAMFEAQGELCAICHDVLTKPNVDHNHRTGATRQLLCNRCNVGLGQFRENPTFLRDAAQYLERHLTKADF